jgi:hypothetical protein
LNGKELTAKDGVQFEKDVANNRYVLVIPKLNPLVHAGKITIKATNLVGTVQHDLDVDVHGITSIAFNKINILSNSRL